MEMEDLVISDVQTKMETKAECWQLLTVDEATYHSWKSLGQSQSLLSDSLVANFLLQHYQKTSCLTLTECFKCRGPLSQYCVKCNVYMGQPLDFSNPASAAAPSGSLDTATESAASASGNADSAAGSLPTDNDAHRTSEKSIALDIKGMQDHSQSTVSFQASDTMQTSGDQQCFDLLDNSASGALEAREEVGADLDGFDTSEAVDSHQHISQAPTVINHTTALDNSKIPCLSNSQDNSKLSCDSSNQDNGKMLSLSSVQYDSDIPNLPVTCKTTKPCKRFVSTRTRSRMCNDLGELAARVFIITDQAGAGKCAPSRPVSQLPKHKPDSPTHCSLTTKVKVVTDAGGCHQGPDDSEEYPVKKRNRKKVSNKETDLGGMAGKIKGDKKTLKRTYPCEMCGQELRSRYELDGHLKVHRGERPFKCSHCPASYTRSYHLTAHMRKHALIKPYPCSHCTKAFTRLGDLKAHEVTHSAHRPFVCEVCGFATKTLNNLKIHKRVHDSSSKDHHVCPHCGVGFRWKSNYRDHLKMHENDRAFACPHCPMTYVQSGSLKRHMDRKHVENRPRPFVCEICGAARYEKTQFEKHMMIHTGVKPHQCDVCGAAFIQANALKGHMKIHTETLGKTNWCSLCGAAFKRFASVKTHIKKVHKDVSMFSIETVEIHVPVRESPPPSPSQQLCQ